MNATAPGRPLRLLAIDTSTSQMSVAVGDGTRVWEHSGEGGAQASSALIPTVQSLLREAGLALADLDAIAFGRGPGSFTGLRTACAVAQGLGFGAGVKLLPVDTLLAVAEDARARHGVQRVVAVIDARMDEVYAAAHDLAAFEAGGAVASPLLHAPEAVQVPEGWVIAGNAEAPYGARLAPAHASAARLPALPTAAAMLRLAPALLARGEAVPAEQAMPAYIRDKVAQTTAEREAARAAAPAPR